MSGMMSNIQYMPSPHGMSKRIRLYHHEPFSIPFQGIGQYGYHDKTKEQDDAEVFKTSHVWMRKCQFKEERNAFLLVSGYDGISGKLNEYLKSLKGNKDDLINKDFVSDIYEDNAAKSMFKDTVVQSLNFLESDLQQKDTVKLFSVPKTPNFPNGCEDSNNSWMLSMDIESKYASTIQSNGIESFISGSHFETCLKDKLSGAIDESFNVIYDTERLDDSDISKGSTGQYERPCYENNKNGTDETNAIKCDLNVYDTSKVSNMFHYENGFENNSIKCRANSSENLKIKDTIIGSIREHKVDQESNINHEVTTIGKSFNHLDKGRFQAKNNDLNSGIKVLSWKTYKEIVRRLPDYKEFSGVIRKATKKVKHPKTDFEPVSPGESTHSIPTLSTLTENVNSTDLHEISNVTEELHENTISKSKQDILLHDLDESENFLDFASGKVEDMVLLIRSTSRDIKLVESESEDIAIALHHVRNIQYFERSDRKLSAEDTNAIINTRSEILKLGDSLLEKMCSLQQGWIGILAAYKINLVMVSRFLYILCSIPIESKLSDQRGLVYAAMQKVDDQIMEVEGKEKDLAEQRNCRLLELVELQDEISRFHRLDTVLDKLSQKCFD